MTSQSDQLTRLRHDIDQIDDRIHDLLMERTALVERVGAVKAASAEAEGVPLRPGREAEILRRLTARHRGPFPLAAMVRIWRELMGALVGLQKPFSIAVCQPERGAGYIELARDHFGVVWPQTIYPSPGHVVRAVADGLASVGVVPLPGSGGQEAWWLPLTTEAANLPKVVGRLPALAVEPTPGRPDPLEAMLIACRPHDQSGADRSLIAVETLPDVSRDRLRAHLGAAGQTAAQVLDIHRGDQAWLHLVEAEGHVGAGDPLLAALTGARDPIRHARVIGGYPLPIRG